MSKDDNRTGYFRFPPHPAPQWDEFCLIVIRFLADSSLFSQTRDEFRVGSGIVTPAPPYPAPIIFLKYFFIILFYTLI